MPSTIKVLIVDDSAFVRQLLSSILASDSQIEVVGTAQDPYDARDKIKTLNPDVLTLDVEMPRMDGISFLDKIMRLRPMPVVMVSTLTAKGAEVTLRALELGAVDFVTKPQGDLGQGLEAVRKELVEKVKAAAGINVYRRASESAERAPVAAPPALDLTRVIAIGSSTGGVEALNEVVPRLPENAPPVLITQHMPPHFTTSFASRLDKASAIKVFEASDEQPIKPGEAYLAPGDRHLQIARNGGGYVCRLSDDAPVTGHKPSVDVLFQSMATVVGQRGVGVILTGMGKDGAKGMNAMRMAGADTIGQDEASCVVYGMPRAAMDLGAVAAQVPLKRVAEEIVRLCGRHA